MVPNKIPALLLLLPMTALAAGCGGSSSNTTHTSSTPPTAASKQSKPASGTVKVDLNEWSVMPAARTVKAGKVTFDVINTGKVPHEMVVVRTAKPAADLAHGGRATEKGSLGEVSGLKSGQKKTLTLKLKPGHYALICNEPGHYMSGMHTDLRVV